MEMSLWQRVAANFRFAVSALRPPGSTGLFAACGGETRVSYGGVAIPPRHRPASGGIIKLQDLSKEFPPCAAGANILYLVSSALPEHAPLLSSRFFRSPCVALVRAAKRCGARVVLNQNGVAYPAWCGRGWRRANRLNAWLLKMADHVIYQSRFAKQSAEGFAYARDGGYSILHNPVDTERFRPARRRESGSGIRLLTAGSFDQAYRVRSALQALQTVRAAGWDAKLTIAGRLAWAKPEDVLREVDALISGLFLTGHVELVAAYSQDDAVALFQSADLLLHPTVNDVCPRVVAEALACGLPVVYVSAGGTGELVGEAGVAIDMPIDWTRAQTPDGAAIGRGALAILKDLPRYRSAARRRATTHLDVRPWLEAHTRLFRALNEVPAGSTRKMGGRCPA